MIVVVVEQFTNTDMKWNGKVYRAGETFRTFTYSASNDDELQARLRHIKAAFNMDATRVTVTRQPATVTS